MTPTARSLGSVLLERAVRERGHVRMAQIASAIGVTEQYASRALRGLDVPAGRLRVKIWRAYSVPIESWGTLTDEPPIARLATRRPLERADDDGVAMIQGSRGSVMLRVRTEGALHRDIAAMLGVGKTAVAKALRGEIVGAHVRARIAAAYGIPVEAWGEPEATPQEPDASDGYRVERAKSARLRGREGSSVRVLLSSPWPECEGLERDEASECYVVDAVLMSQTDRARGLWRVHTSCGVREVAASRVVIEQRERARARAEGLRASRTAARRERAAGAA